VSKSRIRILPDQREICIGLRMPKSRLRILPDGRERDAYDVVSRKVVDNIIQVCELAEMHDDGPFKTGMVMAMEELYFRLTNEKKHLDWSEVRGRLAKERNAAPK
jgi:hypothetical protein